MLPPNASRLQDYFLLQSAENITNKCATASTNYSQLKSAAPGDHGKGQSTLLDSLAKLHSLVRGFHLQSFNFKVHKACSLLSRNHVASAPLLYQTAQRGF